jgi:hypothetical protein
MRSAYRVLAHLIPILVVLQAMVIAWAVFGLGKFIQDGGVVNKAFVDDRDTMHFTAERGFAYHGIGGMMVIPIVALALLIVSFFAKVPGGVQLALVILALVVIQVVLGIVSHEAPWLGLVHALNAFLIIGTSLAAVRRAKGAAAKETAMPA